MSTFNQLACDQRTVVERLQLEFQHHTLMDLNFDELAFTYYKQEYYSYEDAIRKSRAREEGQDQDMDMSLDNDSVNDLSSSRSPGGVRRPEFDRQTSEYFDPAIENDKPEVSLDSFKEEVDRVTKNT